jgi:hypothetical protein
MPRRPRLSAKAAKDEKVNDASIAQLVHLIVHLQGRPPRPSINRLRA